MLNLSPCLLALVALLAACGSPDPIGVYASVKLVTYGFDTSGNVISADFCGVFSLAEGDSYRSPQSGHMYYGCSADHLPECRAQWKEIAETKGSCIGYGPRRDPNTGEALSQGTVGFTWPTQPDRFPDFGTTKFYPMDGEADEQCSALKAVYNSHCNTEPASTYKPSGYFKCSYGQEAPVRGALQILLAGIVLALLRRRRAVPASRRSVSGP